MRLAVASLWVLGCGGRTPLEGTAEDARVGESGGRSAFPAGAAGNAAISGGRGGAPGGSSGSPADAAAAGFCAIFADGSGATATASVPEHQKLGPADGAPGDHFGIAVALDGDSALVGASKRDDNGKNSGAAYVFARSRSSWTEQQKLLPDDGAAQDWFGDAVSLSGDTALVGAVGGAYVFVRTGSSWTQLQTLLPDDGAGQAQHAVRRQQDAFGRSVAVDGETALVGAFQADDDGDNSGSAYVFVRVGTSWTEQQKLLPGDGAAGRLFGTSVSLWGDTALIGAPGHADQMGDSGSAYVFVRVGTSWTEQQRLLASSGAEDDGFGSKVALSGDTALIGAVLDDDRGSNAGAAYVFARTGSVWTEQQKLLASDGAADDWFGGAVSLVDQTAVIGAWVDDDCGDASGAAYVFLGTGALWTERKVVPRDGARGDGFGSAVSASGDGVLIGAPTHNDRSKLAGSAYWFRLVPE
jgi:hypothetical protein